MVQVSDKAGNNQKTGQLTVDPKLHIDEEIVAKISNNLSKEVTYTFIPSGKWQPGGNVPECGPEGHDNILSEYKAMLKYPEKTDFCLVAVKVNKETQTRVVTEVKKETTIVLKPGETLQFLVNDILMHYSDNSGSLTVKWSAQEEQPKQPEQLVGSAELFWYTGVQKVLIDFTTDPPQAIANNVGQSPGVGGTANYTDLDTRKLRLYSDGYQVFNGQTHKVLENGTLLGVHHYSTQAVVIVPAPGSNRDKFYIFTNNAAQVFYSSADLSQGPNGKIIEKDKPLNQRTDYPGEAIGIAPHADGKSFWVLVYRAKAELCAYRVDEKGINASPVISRTGFNVYQNLFRGSIIFSPDWSKVGLSAVDAGIAVGDFDRATGIVSKTDVLLTQQVGYSCTFSPDGTKLYYGRGGAGYDQGAFAKPYQMDLTTKKETELYQLVGFGYSGAKLAPNGKIYWTGISNQYLAVVENPNAAGKDATFKPQGLHLGVEGGHNLPTQTFSFRAN